MNAESRQKITIRSAIPEDVEEITKLCAELGYPATKDRLRNRLRRIRDWQDHAVFVAEMENGSIVGWVHVYLRPSLVAELGTEIGGLVIKQEHRRKGIGKRLMRHAEEWARDRDCRMVTLRSRMDRDAAHHFYPSIGYKRMKSQWKYEKKL